MAGRHVQDQVARLVEAPRAVRSRVWPSEQDSPWMTPGAVRRLDDALLSVYGDTYVDLRGNAHRVPALRTRLAKMSGTE